MLDLSIIIPVYNEEANVAPLVENVVREAGKLDRTYEVILVNDGSTDGSIQALDEAADTHRAVKVVHFAQNCGQTAAMAAGWYYASGKVRVYLDGDRQNDPSDIAPLLNKLDEGYACVSGWRKNRQDAGLRSLFSRVANRLIRHLARVPIHDLGCTLKAYRHDALDPRELFGEMHRFLPIYVQARGGRVGELVVKHHPRVAGESKYGLDRTFRVISDLFLVRVLLKYRTRPSHMFAKMTQYLALGSGASFVVGAAAGALASNWMWFVLGFLSMLILGVGGIVVMSVGWTTELIMRNRYAQSSALPWRVERFVNLDAESAGPQVKSISAA